MRISDWSSDVCSSDLVEEAGGKHRVEARLDARMQDAAVGRCDHQFQHPARRARAGRRVALPLADRPTAEAEHFQRTLDALRIGCVDADRKSTRLNSSH